MRNSLQRLAVVVVGALAFAQTGPDSMTVRRMRADLNFLCSDALAGRLSLDRGAEVAALYIAAEFERAGLKPVAEDRFLQPFPLIAYDPDPQRTRLRLTRQGKAVNFRPGPDFRGGYWRETAIKAPVVFAGYGITAPEYAYDDYAGVDARGKIALIFDHEPQETDPRSIFNGTGHTRHATAHVKVDNARRHGAVAVLLAAEPLRKHSSVFDALPGQGQPLRASAPRQAIEEDSIPLFQVSDNTAAELLKSTGRTPAELQAAIDRELKPASAVLSGETAELAAAATNLRRAKSANVVGLLEGSDPALRSETVIITAHYDHLGERGGQIYRGANDNASGTAGVMELARRFAAATARPRRSLLLIVFGSEEEGLLGSYYYVEHPLRPLETTRAVLNLDMIARDEAHIPQSRGVLEIGGDTANEINLVGVFYSPDLRAAILKANNTGLDISGKFDRDHDLNALFRCDHFPFLLHDIPAVWIFGGWHPGYHEPSDTVDKLNFDKLEKVVRLTYNSALSIGESVSPPRFRLAENQLGRR